LLSFCPLLSSVFLFVQFVGVSFVSALFSVIVAFCFVFASFSVYVFLSLCIFCLSTFLSFSIFLSVCLTWDFAWLFAFLPFCLTSDRCFLFCFCLFFCLCLFIFVSFCLTCDFAWLFVKRSPGLNQLAARRLTLSTNKKNSFIFFCKSEKLFLFFAKSHYDIFVLRYTVISFSRTFDNQTVIVQSK
jgi:hypothetical protein